MRQVDRPQAHRHFRRYGEVLKGIALQNKIRVYAIEGDQAATNDPERIRATGCAVIPVNTGTGCHREADTLAWGVQQPDF